MGDKEKEFNYKNAFQLVCSKSQNPANLYKPGEIDNECVQTLKNLCITSGGKVKDVIVWFGAPLLGGSQGYICDCGIKTWSKEKGCVFTFF